MTDVMDMGLKSEVVRRAATLGTGSTDADFHCVGTTDKVTDKCSMSASGAAKTGTPIRKNHDWMLSSPDAIRCRVSNLNTSHSVITV